MWDYEENYDDDYLYNCEASKMEDDEDEDGEMEALMYSTIHYQDVAPLAKNEQKREVIEATPGSSKQTVKKRKKVKRDKSLPKDKSKSKTKYAVEKFTQFVSVNEDEDEDNKRSKNSKSEMVDLISSTDSDVKVMREVIQKEKIRKSSKKRKKTLSQILQVSSDSDCLFQDNDDSVELPTDISINIKSTRLCNPRINVINTNLNSNSNKKRKLKADSTVKKKKKKTDLIDDNDFVGKMRKFYDSDSSDEERNLQFDTSCRGNWRINDEDRYGWTADKKRFFGRGFNPENRSRCHNCQQCGHFERNCPEPKRIIRCHICGGENHRGDRCLYKICTRCLDVGHDETACHVKSVELKRKCKRCRFKGHLSASCPDLWRRYYLTTTNGSIVKGSKEKNPTVFCYNCGMEGHLGHKCHRMNRISQTVTPYVISYDDLDGVTSDDEERDKMLSRSNKMWKNMIGVKKDNSKRWKSKWKSQSEERAKRHKEREEFRTNHTSSLKSSKSPKRRKQTEERMNNTDVKIRTKERIRKSKPKEVVNHDSDSTFLQLAVNKLKAKIRKKDKMKAKLNDGNISLKINSFGKRNKRNCKTKK